MKNFEEYIKEDIKLYNYNDELCPKFWKDDKFNDRIRKKLIKIAKDFYEKLELETEIEDIVLTGSLANYSYTENSDIDIHIIIKFSKINEDTDLVKTAIDGQRFIWNLRHHIVIKGYSVELYIQDYEEEHRSSGVYSLVDDKWIKKPTHKPPVVDDIFIENKYKSFVYDITELEKMLKEETEPNTIEKYYDRSQEIKEKIMKGRKAGLTEIGEFSAENIIFKKLRTEGYIEKLIEVINGLYDKIFSQ